MASDVADPVLAAFAGHNFLNTADFPVGAIQELVERTLWLKQHGPRPLLAGQVIGLLFFNPSLRTKTSMSAGIARLSGTAIDLSGGPGAYAFEYADGVVMDGATQEHIREAAPVIGEYCDALAVRASELVTRDSRAADASATWAAARADTVVRSFARFAGIPVINLESNVYHPCQGLGDALTLRELFGRPQGRRYTLTWAWHPKPLPTATPHSQLLAACEMGCDVTLAYPEGWDLDPEIVAGARERAAAAGGSLTISHDRREAATGADVICAKSWGAIPWYGDWDAERALRAEHRDWIVDDALMARTHGARFMHCLPVRRNVVVTDSVLDSPASAVVQEAGNRMYAQNALLAHLLGRWPAHEEAT